MKREKAYIIEFPDTLKISDKMEVADWLYSYAKRKFKYTISLDTDQTRQCIEALRKRYEMESYHNAESVVRGLYYDIEVSSKYQTSLDTVYGLYNLTIVKKESLDGIDEDFADKLNHFILNNYKAKNRYDYFSCGYPNKILEACGLNKDIEIVITIDGMRKMLGQKIGKKDEAHNLTEIEVLRVPQLIREPILIINGNTSDSRLVFIEIPRAGRKMFAVIGLDRDLFLGKQNKYNLIASIYSQEIFKIEDKIKSAIATNSIWYCNTNKTKKWLSEAGKLQLLTTITTNSLYSEKDFTEISNAKIINNSHNTNNYKENLQGVSKTFPFAKHIAQLYEKGEKLDWKKAQKIAKDFGIETDTEIMQACELGCVIEARRIAHNGNSLAQQYEEMKDLYDRQVNIKPLDTKSKVLNQYSTPCPLAYLLGTFVNQNHKMNDGKILEPSAGNGLLTTVFNPEDVCVNELDEIRVENLRKLGFYNVANIDASEKTLLDNEYQDKSFRGIITNPPFAKLPSDKKIQRNGWEINTLDYKMAVLALDKMHDDGRASIIVGGKMWNSYWKPLNETSQKQVLFGQWKTFLGYLYAQYNVVDVIYVDGDNIYRKQGTQYPIAIILIDGRHKYDESNKPRYVFDPDKDVIIQTYDQLFDRLFPYVETTQTSDDDEAKRKRAKALMLKMKMAKAKIEIEQTKANIQ